LPMLLSGRSDRLKHESSQIELPPKPDELSIETRRFPVGVINPKTTNKAPEAVESVDTANPSPAQTETIDLTTVDGQEQAADSNQVVANVQVSNVDDAQIDQGEPAGTQASVDSVAKPPQVTSVTLKSEKPESLNPDDTVGVAEGTPRYLVQVASFSNERNANALADMLKAEDLPVLLDVVDRPAGRMYRVRVGPFAKRPDADALVSSLRTKMTDLTPRILDLRPDESAPVSTPSDPLVRWVVQVGSFSNAKAAQELVAKLRLSGLSAFSEKVTSAGSTAYKVRIGPELDRGKAAELAKKVKAEHQLDTFVTTQE
jgi:cell division septation protein DedD